MLNTDIEKEFEGCKLTAYKDIGGVWTIGYGHTRGVKEGDTCTAAQADIWLLQDLHDALTTVTTAVHVAINDNELSALVNLVFNIGAKQFNTSTLLRKLNAGDHAGAALEFIRWNKVKGKVVAGLIRRGIANTKLFNTVVAT